LKAAAIAKIAKEAEFTESSTRQNNVRKLKREAGDHFEEMKDEYEAMLKDNTIDQKVKE